MISKKYFLADGSTTNFLSDYIIKNDEYCRVYVSDSYELPVSAEDRAALLANVSQWELVNNNIVFYEAPAAGKYVTVWVASTPEELDTYIDYAFITYDNIANIETVVDNMDSITTVAGDTTDINTIITNLADINTVAGINTAVTAVADVATEVVAVADIKQEIINVDSNSADISTVATYNSDVSIVSGNIGAVQSVVANETNINTVATNIANVNTVGTNISDVNDVVANMADINQVQDNLTVINTVEDNLTAINTVATNVTDVTNFADVYYGASATAPTTRRDGSALEAGDLWFDTANGYIKVYTGTDWLQASVQGASREVVTATEGQTSVLVSSGYNVDQIDVYLNGQKMITGSDFTATDGQYITFLYGLQDGDKVEVISMASIATDEANLIQRVTFTADGATVTFDTTHTLVSKSSIMVSVNGITQGASAFSVSGTTFTMNETPEDGDVLDVMVFGVSPTSIIQQAESIIYTPVGETSTNVQAHLEDVDANKQDRVYTPSGTGAVARTVESKLGETVSIKDFGAVGDGVTDDSTEINLAIQAGNDGSTVHAQYDNATDVRGTGGASKFVDLVMKDNVDLLINGPTNETILHKNQLSSPYQAIAVTTTAWVGSTAYTFGQKVVNGGQAYYCTASGTSAASGGPTGTGTGIVDGTCAWKSIDNGYYGTVPVNEFRIHAPYHPAIVLDQRTAATYGTTQTAHTAATNLVNAGNSNSSVYKSIVWSQDGQGEWQLVADSDGESLSFNKYINGSAVDRLRFEGTNGDVNIQKTSNAADSYPLDVAGAFRVMTDQRTDVTDQRYDNRIRFASNPSIVLQQKTDTSDNKATISLAGVGGYGVYINAPNVVGVTSFVGLSAGNASGVARAVNMDGFYNAFQPNVDNSTSLGRSSKRWSVVYAATGTINTSDERAKQDIEPLSDAELRVATALKGLVKKFRFKDSVAEKGDAARIHVGVIAQEVEAAFAAEGLDGFRYGILCYDKWDAETDEARGLTEAGDRYGVRYEELLAFIIAAI